MLLLDLLKAFIVGGAICSLAELLVLRTQLAPARILVGCIVAGALLSALGLYGPLVDFAGAGASIPLPGFGHALVTGVRHAVDEIGFMGAFTGGLTSTSAGITSAIFFGAVIAMVFKPKAK